MSERERDDGVDATPVAVNSPSVVDKIRRDMGDNWRQDDQLFHKFFPTEAISNHQYQSAYKTLYNQTSHRWKGIPAKPRSSSSLYTPLVYLMNEILYHHAIPRDKRLFLNTHVRHVRKSKPKPVSPGILLAGVGTEFANTSEERPRKVYCSGISAFEVSLDCEDVTTARDRLAVHMHRIFQNQDNRRFAFGLVITQNIFIVYMFDHSGAVASTPCDYHAFPEQFVAVVTGLASEQTRIGFDDNIYDDGRYTKIRTFESGAGSLMVETHYIIHQSLFQFPSLVGRGTICWLTSRVDDPDSTYVIKDAWIAPSELAGRESEGFILRRAQSSGVVSGVVQIHHFEEVRRGSSPSDLDTILRNRGVEGSSLEERKVERVHTRIIMQTYGKTLDNFSNRRELLLAFHDAVFAHRRLHDAAGILHRDISPRNILINPDGYEGNRGVLIDFDHSIRVGDTSPYSTKTKIGTWRFMSRDVLSENGPHTYLDDLESFYYVFCWILASFEAAGVLKREVPKSLTWWDLPGAFIMKRGYIGDPFNLPISPWFGKSLPALAVRLHKFFRFRLFHPPLSIDPVKDYDEFLSLVRQCITDLEAETPASSGRDVGLKPEDDENPRSGLTPDRTIRLRPSVGRRANTPVFASSARPRRSAAKGMIRA